ncbi:MAG: hypothetical protein SVU32_04355, partial [Candidatus Nanohaloarchaea archaeon]|nr:hypothetical protein [Candidatus Nanohaloarchaea archaeon]
GHTERITKKVTVADQEILIDAFPAGGELQPGVNNTIYVSTRYPDGEPARTTVTINGEHTVTTNQYGIGVFHVVPSNTEQPTARTVPRERFRDDVRQQNNGERFHFVAQDNQGNTAEEDIFFRTSRGNRIAL